MFVAVLFEEEERSSLESRGEESVKRRNFAAALVFLAALLVAALAAASVSAATSSQKTTKAAGKGWELKAGHVNDKGKSLPAQKVGVGQFKPTAPNQPKFINSSTPSNANSILKHDRAIPGKLGVKGGGKAPGAPGAPAAPGAPQAVFVPHAHSLPITNKKYAAQSPGLNAYNQDSVGGYTDTPPDQALAEGNGFVFEAVNNVFMITDTNFGHVTNAEPMEQFWAPAILSTGYCSVSDPKANYDNVTRKWYVTEVAYGPPGCAPGSAVFIAVSTTSDPLSIYNIYVLDTSFDGSVCTADGCLADQPLLGQNRNALFISTNSFDWDTPAFNGSQLYVIDSTGLAAGFLFPNIVYFDIGNNIPTPEGFIGCGSTVFPDNAYCWYSIQWATTPNQSHVTSRGGTEFALSALDWFGSVDNRIALWALTNTSSISSFFPDMFINYAVVGTESYGFPFTDTPFFSPYAEQPGSGNTPLCDFFVGPFCEPGPIANNDDRMNEVKSVVANAQPAHNWGGLNTDALVPDPLGHLHRRSAIAYFDISANAWCLGVFVCGGQVNAQNYVANWNNDVIFPAIGVSSDALNGAMVFTLTGNDHYPSVAVAKVGDHNPITSIPVVLAGQDVLDDFAWYFFGDPRWGDYSAAVGDGRTIYLATEYIQHPSCDDATFVFDPTCGGTRSEFSNWGTGLVKVNV
jgi:hypothetical protein